MILAAFRPETKARLVETGLLAPTVQYVFRRSQRSVLSREAYMSGAAHPSVFPAYEIGLARMVSLANAILPDDIPPMVRIRMLEETEPVEGVDFFGEGLSETFFDTPAAIGRIWRGKDYRRTYLVSAEETVDPNGRPLSFEWRLLRGDPDRVRITPLDGGARARVQVDWQEPRPIGEENPIRSARVDVGVFANNGVHDSAPAILSVLFPAHETRRYEPGPDGAMRIVAIDHADPAKAGVYADPMLMARADWRDDYRYDADDALVGWTRSRPDRGAGELPPRRRAHLRRRGRGGRLSPRPRPGRPPAGRGAFRRDRAGPCDSTVVAGPDRTTSIPIADDMTTLIVRSDVTSA